MNVLPYFEALAVLYRALEVYKATPRKKAKVCNCFFDTRCSDGGSFENHAVVCMAKSHQPDKLSNALDARREALLEWVAKGEQCHMDTSPGQIRKVQGAVAHLVG
jgi:hypothetical protein